MKRKLYAWILVFAMVFSLFGGITKQVEAAGEAKYVYDAALLPNGDIAVLYISEGSVYYGVYDPDLSKWSKEEVAVGKDCALALDDTGVAHIVYINSNDDLGYVYHAGSVWSTPEIIDSISFGGIDGALTAPDIAVDGNGHVHLVYFDAKGGYEGGNDYSSYEKPDLVYATNASGAFVKTVRSYSHGWFWSPDGWRNLAYEPAKIVWANGDYHIGLKQYQYDKSMSTQYHTYSYNLLCSPATPTNDLGYYIRSATTNNDLGFSLFEIESNGSNVYSLFNLSGSLHITNGVTEIPAATKAFATNGADLFVDDAGLLYYAGISGSTLLLYQDATFKESLTLPVAISGSHTRMATVCDEANQYVLYTDTAGALQIADVSLSAGVNDVETYEVPDLIPVTIAGISIGDKTYDGAGASYSGTPTATETASGDSATIAEYTYTWYEGATPLASAPKEVGDYQLVVSVAESDDSYSGSLALSFSINAAPLTITGVTATDRAYDGSTLVVITGGTLVGVIDGDTVTSTVPTTGAIATAGVDDDKDVTLADITLGGADADNYALTQPTGIKVNITAAPLTIEYGTVIGKTYDGAATATVTLVGFTGLQDGEALVRDTDYTVAAAFDNANAGSAKNVSGVVSLLETSKTANYSLVDGAFSDTADIAKADGLTATNPVDIEMVKNFIKSYAFDLSGILLNQDDTGDVTYTLGALGGDDLFEVDPANIGASLTFTAAVVAEGRATLVVNVHSQNYEDTTATLTFVLVDRTPVTISGISVADQTYDGQAVSYTGTAVATDGETPVMVDGFTYSWYDVANGVGLALAPADAGDYKLIVAVSGSDDTYMGEMEFPFAIQKKSLIIKAEDQNIFTDAEFPILTLAYVGLVNGESGASVVRLSENFRMEIQDGSGHALANSSVPGEYPIVFTNIPAYDADNYQISLAEGILTIENPVTVTIDTDGDTTSVVPETEVAENRANAAMNTADIEAILAEIDGKDATAVVISPDVTANIDGVAVKLPKTAAGSLAGRGVSLTVATPIADIILNEEALDVVAATDGESLAITAARNVDGTITIEIKVGSTILRAVNGVKVKVAAPATKAGAVLVIMGEGSQEIVIKKSIAVGDGVLASMAGSATLKLIDNTKVFVDVSDKHWAAKYVAFASSRELFLGTSTTEFSPDEAMTRAMFATVLYRLEGSPGGGGLSPFSDVRNDTWYTDGVAWASSNGIVNGTGNGKFEPNKKISREEMAVMIFRYCNAIGYDTTVRGDIQTFVDGNHVSSWAREEMSFAVGAGFIGGKGNNDLDPQAGATRAEVATILQRVVSRILQ